MKKRFALLLVCILALGLYPALAEPVALTKDIVVLYTNDVHCAIDQGFGYAGLATYRDLLVDQGNHVTLVDCGDALQGEPVGTLSKGESIIQLMNTLGYDVATIGNHEFDYGMDRFLELADSAAFPYVACNLKDLRTGESVFDAYQMLEYDGVKVAYVGIATPKTFTSSTPVYFQDEEGNFVYSFYQGGEGQELYGAVQSAVDEARAEGAQYVIALAHLGIEEECSPWMSTEVIANTTGIDVVLDGHSHSVLPQERVKNKAGEDVLLSQTGTKLSHIGVLRISQAGALETSLLAWNKETSDAVGDIQAQLSETLNQVVARSDVDLVINQPGTDPAVRLIRNAETNLGDLCADAYRAISGADISLLNGGSIRVDIKAGDITNNDILKVHPYGNGLCMVEATGQQVLDALEMGAREVPGENGGFLQVSGLTYEIHTGIPSSVEMTEEGLFAGVNGEYRVKNVLVDGAPLQLEATYTVASHNYLIKNAGDGMNMFQDSPLLLDNIMLDNQVLITYIVENLGGVVSAGYEDIYGQGRIVGVGAEAQ